MQELWIDGHIDLAYLAQLHGDLRGPIADPNARCISFSALRAGGVRVALGTIFTERGSPDTPAGYAEDDDIEGAHRAGVRQLEWYEAMEREGALRIVRCRDDLAGVESTSPGDHAPLRIVILMEGCDPIRSPQEARWWFNRGVRAAGMAWALGTRYAGGNGRPGPLSAAGRELVPAFDEVGILHDASHLSDEGFAELLECTPRRIIASHSNSRVLTGDSQRHLTDDGMRAIAARDGLIGLNLFGKFLASGREATRADALNHIDHAALLAGRDRVGLGSDFDGGFAPADIPEGLRRPQELGSLSAGLRQRGWPEPAVFGFTHANWLRVLRAALPD